MDKRNSHTVPLKTQAKALRKYLAEQDIELGHSKCLEAVARMRGFKNWDTASAFFGNAEYRGNWRMSTSPRWDDVMLDDPEAEWAMLTLPREITHQEVAGVLRRDDGEWVPRNYEAALLLELSSWTEFPDGTTGRTLFTNEPLFMVSNHHAVSSGTPPTIDADSFGHYSYFENKRGEQALFHWDPESHRGILWIGDNGWDPIAIDSEGTLKPSTVLSPEEATWLSACMKAVQKDGV